MYVETYNPTTKGRHVNEEMEDVLVYPEVIVEWQPFLLQ